MASPSPTPTPEPWSGAVARSCELRTVALRGRNNPAARPLGSGASPLLMSTTAVWPSGYSFTWYGHSFTQVAGYILRTTDGGATWNAQSSGTLISPKAVSFTDANNGTVVGGGGSTVLRWGYRLWVIDDPDGNQLFFNYPSSERTAHGEASPS